MIHVKIKYFNKIKTGMKQIIFNKPISEYLLSKKKTILDETSLLSAQESLYCT